MKNITWTRRPDICRSGPRRGRQDGTVATMHWSGEQAATFHCPWKGSASVKGIFVCTRGPVWMKNLSARGFGGLKDAVRAACVVKSVYPGLGELTAEQWDVLIALAAATEAAIGIEGSEQIRVAIAAAVKATVELD